MKKYLNLLLTKTFIVMIGCLFLVSCNGATDERKCLENVKALFPNSKIYKEVDNDYVFYVVDSTGIKKATTLNLNDSNVDGVEILVEVK